MGKLLAIDGSTKATGWSIYDIETKELLEYGVFKQDASEEKDTRRRIIYMINGIDSVLNSHNDVVEIFMEDVPPTVQNAVTVKMLSILQGGVIGLSMKYKISIDIDNFVLPNIWHSDFDILKSKGDLKEQSVNLANELLGTHFIYKSKSSKFNEDDISDAVLIGYWRLHKDELREKKAPKKAVQRKKRQVVK